MVRSFVGLISNTAIIAASGFIPLAVLSIISKTNGFWASLIGFLLLGDTLGCFEIFSLLIGFVGVYLIVYNKDDVTQVDYSYLSFIIGVILAFTNAIGNGFI